MNVYNVLKHPLISEKATAIKATSGAYVFMVEKVATKPEIKKAVETIFNVKVDSVNTVTIKGKQKVFRGRIGRRSDYKKAIVRLAKDQQIDLGIGV